MTSLELELEAIKARTPMSAEEFVDGILDYLKAMRVCFDPAHAKSSRVDAPDEEPPA